MSSEELDPRSWGRAQIEGAEERDLAVGIPTGNGGSREMSHL